VQEEREPEGQPAGQQGGILAQEGRGTQQEEQVRREEHKQVGMEISENGETGKTEDQMRWEEQEDGMNRRNYHVE
jgi:hypothetical protein